MANLVALIRECCFFGCFSHDIFARYVLATSPLHLAAKEPSSALLKLLAKLPIHWDSEHECNQRRIALYGFSHTAKIDQLKEYQDALSIWAQIARRLYASTPDAGRALMWTAIGGQADEGEDEILLDSMEVDRVEIPIGGFVSTLCPERLVGSFKEYLESDGALCDSLIAEAGFNVLLASHLDRC
jgi:hypothetical protein